MSPGMPGSVLQRQDWGLHSPEHGCRCYVLEVLVRHLVVSVEIENGYDIAADLTHPEFCYRLFVGVLWAQQQSSGVVAIWSETL